MFSNPSKCVNRKDIKSDKINGVDGNDKLNAKECNNKLKM
jgi:hypothetical protein